VAVLSVEYRICDSRSRVWVLSTIAHWPWASCLHLCASVTKQYNLVPVKGRWLSEAGKVAIGLATHWSCHRLGGLSTYGLKAHVREMCTCLSSTFCLALLYLFLL